MVFTIAAARSPFQWNEANRRHVREADVEPYEAEEAVLDLRRIGASAYAVESERRWALLGATEEGRVLFVVFTRREGRIRIITARDAELAEKRRYRGRGK